jgi:hypothetical protein
MADELLRHIQTHYGELRKVRYMENGTSKQLLTGQCLGVLLSMAGHAHHRDFVCYAGLRTISEESGLNKQNCSKWRNLMVDAGWLEPDGVEPSGNGRGSLRFIITLPGLPVPQPTEMPKPGGFVPTGVSANVPTNVPAIVPTNVPAGSDRTEQNKNIKTHTEQRESVSVKKALKNKLEALGLEYAKRQQKASSGRVEIENPTGWVRSVAKAVTQPKGEHYETACGLIEAYPEADTAELCDQLEQALSPDPFGSIGSSKDKGGVFFAPGSGRIPTQLPPMVESAPVPMPYPLKERRLLSIYRERGYSAALEYTNKDTHSPAEADQLKQALDAHALSEAGIEQEHLRMSEEQAQIAAQLEAGYSPERDAEIARELEAGIMPEPELARQLESVLEPDPVAQLAARFTDIDT